MFIYYWLIMFYYIIPISPAGTRQSCWYMTKCINVKISKIVRCKKAPPIRTLFCLIDGAKIGRNKRHFGFVDKKTENRRKPSTLAIFQSFKILFCFSDYYGSYMPKMRFSHCWSSKSDEVNPRSRTQVSPPPCCQ